MPRKTMKDNTKMVLASLAGVPLIMVLGNSMLIPVFPEIKEAVKISQFQVGLLITFFSIPAGLAIPFLGFLSDRIGRKKVIVPALIVYGLGGLITGLAPLLFSKPFGFMLAGRIVQGVGAAGTAPVAMALVGDIFNSQERSKALGIIESANGMGKVLSPILGSLIAMIIWYALFFAYAALAVPVAIAVWLLVKEPQNNQRGQSLGQYWEGIKGIFKGKGVSLGVAFLAGMLVLFTLFGLLSYLSDVLEEKYGIEGLLRGVIIAVPVLFLAVTAYLSGLFFQKHSEFLKPFVVLGLALIALALGTSLIGENPIFLLALAAIMGIGGGMVLPSLNNLVTGSAPLEKRGAITSIYGSVRFIGVALGPPTFSLLSKGGVGTMYLTVAIAAALAAVLNYFLLNVRVMTDSQEDSQASPGKNIPQSPQDWLRTISRLWQELWRRPVK